MPIEIERKFLIVGDGWSDDIETTRHIEDHLIASFGGGKARIRICDGQTILTIKGPRKGAARSEYHLPLAHTDAEAMIAEFSRGAGLLKRRNDVKFGGLTWQIDEFLGPLTGLVTADVEIPDQDYPIEMPHWAGVEITGDRRFSSGILAEAAYEMGAKLENVVAALQDAAQKTTMLNWASAPRTLEVGKPVKRGLAPRDER